MCTFGGCGLGVYFVLVAYLAVVLFTLIAISWLTMCYEWFVLLSRFVITQFRGFVYCCVLLFVFVLCGYWRLPWLIALLAFILWFIGGLFSIC